MTIVATDHPVYYRVVRKSRSRLGNFAPTVTLGIYEDIGDAVARIVTARRNKFSGELGIVRTSCRDRFRFVPRSLHE